MTTITIRETHRSRPASYGKRDQSHRKRYRLQVVDLTEGDEEDEEVWLKLFETAPLVVDIPDADIQLIRQRFDYEPLGAGLWDATVIYGNPEDPESKDPSEPPQPPETTPEDEGAKTKAISFDMAGGTQLVTRSKETVDTYSYSMSFDPPDLQRFINVTPDGIKGTEVFVPSFAFQIRKAFPSTFDWIAFRVTVQLLAGKVNLDPFYSFQQREVLFKGVSGGEREDGAFDVTFHFEVQLSIDLEDDVMIGDIGPIEKAGWDYLWVDTYTELDPVVGLTIEKPRSARVERIYDATDFALLGIGESDWVEA